MATASGWRGFGFVGVVAAVGLLGACVPKPPPVPEPVLPSPCPHIAQSYNYFEVTPVQARQGATLTVKPQYRDGPDGPKDIPAACLTDWKVSPASAAKLSADRKTLTIAENAPPGTKVSVSATLDGQTAGTMVTVLGRDELTLAGAWHQREGEGCTLEYGNQPPPVRELVFTPEGRFTVTYMPFETYTDYWGTYTFDPATGAVAMTVTGGNAKPYDADLEGTVQVTKGRLAFTGVFFGSKQEPNRPTGACRLEFGGG